MKVFNTLKKVIQRNIDHQQQYPVVLRQKILKEKKTTKKNKNKNILNNKWRIAHNRKKIYKTKANKYI